MATPYVVSNDTCKMLALTDCFGIFQKEQEKFSGPKFLPVRYDLEKSPRT